MTPESVERLTDGQRSEVLGLVNTATRVDEVAPLSEQVLLAVRDGDAASTSPASTTTSRHLLAYAGTHLAGYAHLEQGVDGEVATAEVVVDPSYRRQGVGTVLIHALEGAIEDATAPQATSLRLWSHGDLAGARAFAIRGDYSIVRELWQMRRSLHDVTSLPAVSLPEGFGTRHFVVGRDEEAWLRVNARAFVDHPEQGRMTLRDLVAREREPWFDPRGLLLAEQAGVLLGSVWTKVHPASDTEPAHGEIYVLGVDPAAHGRGLGRLLAARGMAHLRERGLGSVMLYTGPENAAAVHLYRALGFEIVGTDLKFR